MKIYLLVFLSALLPIFSTAQPKVIIGELLMSHTSPGRGDTETWVTLHNYGKDSVNLTGWKLKIDEAGQVFTFPEGSVIKSRAHFKVVYRSGSLNGFSRVDSGAAISKWVGDRWFFQRAMRAGAGASIKLCRRNGRVQDSVCYNDVLTAKKAQLQRYYGAVEFPKNQQMLLQRRNVTIADGHIVSIPSDYEVATISAAAYSSGILMENGIPVYQLSYAYDASGNRTWRTVILPLGTYQSTQDSEEDEIADAPMPAALRTASVGTTGPYTDRLEKSDVIIYPNPTRGSLAVEVRNLPADVPYRLVVYSMYGVVVFQQENMSSYTTIDLTRYAQGLYTMRIISPESYLEWRILKE